MSHRFERHIGRKSRFFIPLLHDTPGENGCEYIRAVFLTTQPDGVEAEMGVGWCRRRHEPATPESI